MSVGLDLLKSKKISELHELTHISQKNLQYLLDRSFDKINRVHFVGFVKILEDKFNIDLSDFKAEGLAHYGQIKNSSEHSELFVHIPQNNNKIKIVLVTSIIVAVALFIIFQLYNKVPSQSTLVGENINNVEINQALEKIDQKDELKNEVLSPLSQEESIENNQTDEKDENSSKLKEPIAKEQLSQKAVALEDKNVSNELVNKEIVLTPKKEAWLGVIDLQTKRKLHNSVVKGEYVLDSSKDLLIVVGHGDLAIREANVTTQYKEPSRTRFLLKDSKIEKIDLEKFKELNQGQAW